MSYDEYKKLELTRYIDAIKGITNFVFLFGAAERGKSVVTSSVFNFLSSLESRGHVAPLRLDAQGRTDKGIELMRRMQHQHTNHQFPERTVLFDGEPIFASLKFSPDTALSSPELTMTFLDVPGDEITTNRAYADYGHLAATINALIKVDGLKLVFILVTSPDTAQSDDLLMSSFIDHVSSIDSRFDRSNFLLLLAKWDTYVGGLSPAEFVAKNMRVTDAQLHGAKHSIAAFSIGDVATVDGRPLVTRFEPKYAKNVVNWLYLQFTGKPLYRLSWWQRALGGR